MSVADSLNRLRLIRQQFRECGMRGYARLVEDVLSIHLNEVYPQLARTPVSHLKYARKSLILG